MLAIKNYFYLYIFMYVLNGIHSVQHNFNNLSMFRSTRQIFHKCYKNQFTCFNQQCLPLDQVCNGIKNCIDGSDETWEACEKKYPNSCTLPLLYKDIDLIINCGDSRVIKIFSSIRGDFVEELTLITFPCNGGYEPSSDWFKSVCLKGKWTPELSDCIKTCPPLKLSNNTKLICYRNGEPLNCSDNHFPGTVVRPQCDLNFVSNVEESVCSKTAEWNEPNIECISCGTTINQNPPFQFPWTVAIYEKQFKVLICAGTIVSPNIIITAATCFSNHKGTEPDNYIVLTGKRKRVFAEKGADLQGFYTIKKIILHENFRESTSTNDIAIIQLSQKINYNTAVSSSCFITDESKYLDSSKNTWGMVNNFIVHDVPDPTNSILYVPDELEESMDSNLILQYVPNKQCRNSTPDFMHSFLSDEKFCAKLKTNNPLFFIDKGAGFFTKNNDNKFILRGVANDMFSAVATYRIFTDISKYSKWISNSFDSPKKQEILTKVQIQHKKSDLLTRGEEFIYSDLQINCTAENMKIGFASGCTLPNKNFYHIEYEVKCFENIFQSYCNRSTENAPVSQHTSIRYKCQHNYSTYSETSESVCFNGKWNPQIEHCKKICEKLKSDNVQLQCYHEGRSVNCSGSLIVNTEVSATCYPEYKRKNATTWKDSLFCKEDGKWNNLPLLECIPICGRPSTVKITPTIHNGENVTLGEFPWHAAVYEKTTNYTLICGATIISPYAFISAAHCFYNRSADQYRNASDYEIVVSKLTRDYEQRDSETTRSYEIERLIENTFKGANLRYQRDIIILVSKTRIIFNSQVCPICLFEDPNTYVANYASLDIPGWGKDEEYNPSRILKVAHLPFIHYDECTKVASPTILEYLTTEKFCTGFINDTTLDQGDSGGGLVLRSSISSFYYLVGIVSFKATDGSTLSLSTYVLEYMPWIRQQLDEIKKMKNSQ